MPNPPTLLPQARSMGFESCSVTALDEPGRLESMVHGSGDSLGDAYCLNKAAQTMASKMAVWKAK
jgi:hypothetical protein